MKLTLHIITFAVTLNTFSCVWMCAYIPSTVVPLTESSCYISTDFRIHPLSWNGKSCVKETHGKNCPVPQHELHNVCLRGKSSESSVTSALYQTQPDAQRKASWEDISAQHQALWCSVSENQFLLDHRPIADSQALEDAVFLCVRILHLNT